MNKKSAIIFCFLCLGNIFVSAQSVQNKSVSNQLTLKTTRFKGDSPYYNAVAEANAKPSGGWTPLFQKTPNWRQPAGTLPVKAVNIVSRVEGDAVKVNISVFTGHKFHEKEEFVADYLIRENETVVLKELSKFGVEPFEIAVVRTVPSVSVLPSVVSNTDSLQVSIEPNFSTLSSYKIRVLNNSSKAVSAFAFVTTSNNAILLSGMPQGLDGKPLIKPGEIYADIIPNTFRAEKNSNEQISAAVPNQTFNITTVIFVDGTYEGELQSAAQFLAFTLGRKSQLKQMISVLQEAAENGAKADELSRQISNLSTEVDEAAFNEFLKQFPPVGEKGKSGLRDSVEIASNFIKKTILTELKTFEANQKKLEANALQDWLKATKEKYQNWLARLSVAR